MKRALGTIGVAGLALLGVTAPASAADKVIVCHAGGTAGTSYQPIDISSNGLHGHDHHKTDVMPPNRFAAGGLNWTTAGKATYALFCPEGLPAAGEEPGTGGDPVGEEPAEEQPPAGGEPDTEEPAGEQPPAHGNPTDGDGQTNENPTEEAPSEEAPVNEAAPVEQPAANEVPAKQQPAANQGPAQETVTVTAEVAAVPARSTAAVASGLPATGTSAVNQGFNAQTAAGGTDIAPGWLGGLGVMLTAAAAVAVRRRSRLETRGD